MGISWGLALACKWSGFPALFVSGILLAFVYFYPILDGMPVPAEQYSQYQWLGSWKL